MLLIVNYLAVTAATSYPTTKHESVRTYKMALSFLASRGKSTAQKQCMCHLKFFFFISGSILTVKNSGRKQNTNSYIFKKKILCAHNYMMLKI